MRCERGPWTMVPRVRYYLWLDLDSERPADGLVED